MQIRTKLPKVGTTIFSVMSQLATQHKAINLGQGFPDFDGPQALRDALSRAMSEDGPWLIATSDSQNLNVIAGPADADPAPAVHHGILPGVLVESARIATCL